MSVLSLVEEFGKRNTDWQLQIAVKTIYNLFFHPLAPVPGPFWSRISSIPSFFHACKGDRHIWSWQQFEIYGDKFRAGPSVILFRSPEAYNTIYNYKANAKKAKFYSVWETAQK